MENAWCVWTQKYAFPKQQADFRLDGFTQFGMWSSTGLIRKQCWLILLHINAKWCLYSFVHNKKIDYAILKYTVPGVSIWAFCRPGISLMRQSCVSGGIVMDKPWGYMRSEVQPSGSSHTWCRLPGNRNTFDSMDGQYLQDTSNVGYQLNISY